MKLYRITRSKIQQTCRIRQPSKDVFDRCFRKIYHASYTQQIRPSRWESSRKTNPRVTYLPKVNRSDAYIRRIIPLRLVVPVQPSFLLFCIVSLRASSRPRECIFLGVFFFTLTQYAKGVRLLAANVG